MTSIKPTCSMPRPRALLAASLIVLASCAGSSGNDPDGAVHYDAMVSADAPATFDAAVVADANSVADATAPDAGGPCDSCTELETCWNDTLCVSDVVSMPGGYFIDATEVTRRQYHSWLQTEPSTDGQPGYCDWNTDFTPDTVNVIAGCNPVHWPPTAADTERPVDCVDWCDAQAYCTSIGKSLCGGIAGGAAPYDDFADPTTSMWHNACSSGGANTLPYGSTYESNACNGANYGAADTIDVASLETCQSPVTGYGGVFDLSGNVAELVDACDGETGEMDECRSRGGSFDTFAQLMPCAIGFATMGRDMTARSLGFRCCDG